MPQDLPGQAAARALLVVDHAVLGEVVSLALAHGHYVTRTVPTADEAARAVVDWFPHLLIVDIDGCGIGGLARLRRDTGRAARVPVVALTRRSDLQVKLAAFECGVDDILTVPFSPEEFVARVLAIMRRSYGDIVAFKPILRIGDLEIDILHRRVRTGATEIHLTALELSLLYLLAANAGRVLTRDEILTLLWGTEYVVESNVVDRHIRGLRMKLQDRVAQHRYIVSVPGRGYRFLSKGADAELRFSSPTIAAR
jgi:DNA-binding response OmpR family regulator